MKDTVVRQDLMTASEFRQAETRHALDSMRLDEDRRDPEPTAQERELDRLARARGWLRKMASDGRMALKDLQPGEGQAAITDALATIEATVARLLKASEELR